MKAICPVCQEIVVAEESDRKFVLATHSMKKRLYITTCLGSGERALTLYRVTR